jgi:hypothetical protein
MAVYTEKQLAQNAQASTSETTIYTVPASTTTIVKQIIICNTTGSAADYSLSIVPSGGSAGDSNRILKLVSFAANSTTVYDLSQVMATGGFISILQGTSAAVTVTISGVEKA